MCVKKEDQNIDVMVVSKENLFSQYCQQLDNIAKGRCQEGLHILGIIEDPNVIFNDIPPRWYSHHCL